MYRIGTLLHGHSINSPVSKTKAYASVDTETHKACRDCAHIKPRSEFNPKPGTRDGLHPYCKICTEQRAVAYHQRTMREKAISKASSPTTVNP